MDASLLRSDQERGAPGCATIASNRWERRITTFLMVYAVINRVVVRGVHRRGRCISVALCNVHNLYKN
jgi:hypothetical protein